MPKKKSLKKSAGTFTSKVNEIDGLLREVRSFKISKSVLTAAYELAIIRLYAAFERFMLDCIVGAVNNDTSVLAATAGVSFPKHLTDEVCEYLVVGSGYFDFKGRDGLINRLKQYMPGSHYVVVATKKSGYKNALDRLCALRNFAAHQSTVSKQRAREVAGCNLGSAGSWLKCEGRYEQIAGSLLGLAREIKLAAPF